jgi:hypothetical protein
VKGPFALNSFITAIADDGDLATKITPNKIATIKDVLLESSSMNGICAEKKKITDELSISVMTNCPIVIHLILNNLLLRSSIYNSAPAEKAIIASARLFRKFNFGSVSEGMKFKTEEPAIIPVTINPVIKGNLIF